MKAATSAAPLPFAELVVVDDREPHPAALNMALDEVLLAGLEGTAVLRCYRWSHPSVSFGCFGQVATVRAEYPHAEPVRRWTGGGTVVHGRDFTYTLLVPRALPLATLPASEAYRLIHNAVASALAAAGWPGVEAAEAVDVHQSHAAEALPFLKPCFAHPVPYDLLAAGRKIAGGAQRRTRRGLLHQGSIQGAFFEDGTIDNRWDELRRNLAVAFARESIFVPLAAAEITAARELAATKYEAKSWMERL